MTRMRFRPAAPAILSAALAALLSACGTSAPDDPFRRAGGVLVEEFGTLTGIGQAEAPDGPGLTREQLDEVPFATILVGRPGSPARAAMFAAAVNDDYVTYVNAARQSVTLRGGQVTATHGLIADLAAYRSDPAADPVVRRRAPEAWPQEVVRVYRDRDAAGRLFSRTMICRPRVLGPEPVEILGASFDTLKVEEPCESPTRSILNRYWIEPGSGFVRRSEQWAGLSGPLVVEVYRPIAEGG